MSVIELQDNYSADPGGPTLRLLTGEDLHVEWDSVQARLHGALELALRVVAGLAIIVLLPLLVGIALAIRVASPGPGLFRQVRVGQDGRHFVIWKFRTMHVKAEEQRAEIAHLNEVDGVLFKIRNDPRIFSLGSLLRRYSLDELPQLWNVVRGEMAFVGPRPALPCEVERYDAIARRRLLVKPGLTGLWQVSGRSDLDWDQSLRLDLEYVSSRRPALDLQILCKTFGAVFSGRGA